MNFETLKVEVKENLCFIQFNRPEANNTINDLLVEEFHRVLELCEDTITVLVLEGNSEVFCMGADFKEMVQDQENAAGSNTRPRRLYQLWQKMVLGPYVIVSFVEGKVYAGGMGFIAVSDIVIAGQNSQFCLSELLFGLYPACVLPFLIRRIGFQRANYMTLMTQPFSGRQALEQGIADVLDSQEGLSLRKHLARLRHLPKTGISRYKSYAGKLCDFLSRSEDEAVEGNTAVFSDPQNIERISRYVEEGRFPWED